MNQQDQRAFDIVRKLFKNDYGQPFEMTPGQISLFRAIYEKQHPRLQFECYTQYGKSDIVSMAVLLRVSTFPEKWGVLGATKDKAGIIMEKLIKHIFENDYTLGKFQVGKDESLESIRRHKSKEHITFRVDGLGNMGEVVTLSAEARRKTQDAGDILIGHGSQNLIEDDSALIPDPIHGKALRMLGGHKDNFLLKITNTFGRNHAWRSSNDPNFRKYVIDYNQGIAEGRITPEYIEEMRNALDPIMFGILYECKYPPSDMVEEGGWMPLLTAEDIEEAQRRRVEPNGTKRLGGDIAEGTNFNAFVIRQTNYAKVKDKTQEKDLMKTADRVKEIRTEEHVPDGHVFLDGIGLGSGVVSRCRQMGMGVIGVRTGDKPTEKTEEQKIMDPIMFYNLRAELNWKMARWIKEGGALEPSPDWMQLAKLRYKVGEGKTVKIMSKEEMRARGMLAATESTDVPDALALTFAEPEVPKTFGSATGSLPAYYPEIGL